MDKQIIEITRSISKAGVRGLETILFFEKALEDSDCTGKHESHMVRISSCGVKLNKKIYYETLAFPEEGQPQKAATAKTEDDMYNSHFEEVSKYKRLYLKQKKA